MGFFKPSVKTLVGRGDVHALIEKLDQKDMGEAWIGLQVLRERAVPALVAELGTAKGDVACAILADIGAPALPALVAIICGGPDDRAISAGTAVATMRGKGVRVPDDVAAQLEAVWNGGSEVPVGCRVAAGAALGKLSVPGSS
jgi:hypothetical protein